MTKIQIKGPDDIFRPLCGIILAVLFTALPLDRGGLYPWSKAFLGILIFTFISLKLLFPSGEVYPKGLRLLTGIYFIIAVISIVFSTDRHLSIQDTLYQIAGAGVFLMGYYFSKNRRTIEGVLIFLQWTLLLNCAVAIFYYLIIPSVIPRAHGNFFQPNVLGTFLVMLTPSALGAYLQAKSPLKIALSAVVSAIALTTLIKTDSTGALISASAVTIPLLYLSAKRENSRNFMLKTGVMILAVILLFSLIKPGALSKNNFSEKDLSARRAQVADPESNKARFHFWSAALKIAGEKPLTGWGAGTFGYQYTRYQMNPKFYSKYPHNFYLATAAERGFPALLALLAVFGFLGINIYKSLNNNSQEIRQNRTALFGLALGLCGVLIHILAEVSFNFSGVFILFFALAGYLSGLGQPEEVLPERTPKARLLRIIASLITIALIFPLLNNFASEKFMENGRMAEESGRLDDAEVYYKRAVMHSPLESEAVRRLASFYYSRGDAVKALALMKRAIDLSPSRARLYLLKGRILFESGKINEAMTDFNRAIYLDPVNQVMAYEYLGDCHIIKNEPDKALNVFSRAAEYYENLDLNAIWQFRTDVIKPQLSSIYGKSGNIMTERKEYSKAVDYYQKSIALAPGASSYFGMGYSLFQLGRDREAEEAFTEVTKLDPSFPAPYLYLSYIQKKLGQQSKAHEYYILYEKLRKEKEKREKEGPSVSPPSVEEKPRNLLK